eukprot:1160651-Pelagomonas_calceolata.AAC.3
MLSSHDTGEAEGSRNAPQWAHIGAYMLSSHDAGEAEGSRNAPQWAHIGAYMLLSHDAGEAKVPHMASGATAVVHSVLLDECTDTVLVAAREAGKVAKHKLTPVIRL